MFTFRHKAECYIKPELIETLVDLSHSLVKRGSINKYNAGYHYLLESCSTMFTAGRQTGQTKEILNYISKNKDKYLFVLICNKMSAFNNIEKISSSVERLALEKTVICTSVGNVNNRTFDTLRGLKLDKPLVIFTDALFEKDRMNATVEVCDGLAPMYKTNDFLHAVVHIGSII